MCENPAVIDENENTAGIALAGTNRLDATRIIRSLGREIAERKDVAIADVRAPETP